jgi:hypothetical protein
MMDFSQPGRWPSEFQAEQWARRQCQRQRALWLGALANTARCTIARVWCGVTRVVRAGSTGGSSTAVIQARVPVRRGPNAFFRSASEEEVALRVRRWLSS